MRFSYSYSVSPALARPSPVFLWLILLLGVFEIALCGLGLWNGLTYAFQGQSATGKVIEFHATGAHSASIVGQVEVTIPGRAPFRAEVDDALGAQNWVVGGALQLRCAEIHAGGYMSCSANSGWSHLVFPLLFMSIGAGMVWWSTRRIRGKPFR
jgi:hypothetical protein